MDNDKAGTGHSINKSLETEITQFSMGNIRELPPSERIRAREFYEAAEGSPDPTIQEMYVDWLEKAMAQNVDYHTGLHLTKPFVEGCAAIAQRAINANNLVELQNTEIIAIDMLNFKIGNELYASEEAFDNQIVIPMCKTFIAIARFLGSQQDEYGELLGDDIESSRLLEDYFFLQGGQQPYVDPLTDPLALPRSQLDAINTAGTVHYLRTLATQEGRDLLLAAKQQGILLEMYRSKSGGDEFMFKVRYSNEITPESQDTAENLIKYVFKKTQLPKHDINKLRQIVNTADSLVGNLEYKIAVHPNQARKEQFLLFSAALKRFVGITTGKILVDPNCRIHMGYSAYSTDLLRILDRYTPYQGGINLGDAVGQGIRYAFDQVERIEKRNQKAQLVLRGFKGDTEELYQLGALWDAGRLKSDVSDQEYATAILPQLYEYFLNLYQQDPTQPGLNMFASVFAMPRDPGI